MKGSSIDEKLILYADRFQARTDVYALYWENARRGTRGWKPAVAGGWHRGIDSSRARYLPLTREVLIEHLAPTPLFIGLYPLFSDSSCRFLVADFDGAVAMLDALAYAKAGRAEGVPTAVELSKSGRGAHVWVFFAEAIPAATARAVGTVLLHEAMLLRGTMDLASYDRLFPNQEVLPDGGFGNLIAAPLEGIRRPQGLTVFLDLATLEPHPDQWEFLSTLDRLSPRDAWSLARRARRTVVGSEVTQLSRSLATKVQPQLPTIVHADLAAGLSVASDQLTPAAVTTFKHAASIANPKFYELQRLRKSTWDTPRFLRGYDVTLDDRLVLPRGLRHDLAQILERGGSQLAINDLRNPGAEIEVAFNGTLDDRQALAVSAILAHDDGVLVAPPGSGKTVIACAIIAERAVSTVVLLDRKVLADQWRERIRDFLGIKPGQLGGGRTKLSHVVDLMLLPTLARRDAVAEVTEGYGQVIVDECHHLGAAAYDHSVKAIGAQFWLGLTATPVRRDGLQDLVSWQLGPIRHVVDPTRESTLLDLSDVPEARDRLLYVHETALPNDVLDRLAASAIAEAHRALVADEPRNTQIVDDVVAALARGRNCLLLTRRVAHLNDLADRLVRMGHQPVLLHGGMVAADRRAAVAKLSDTRIGEAVLVIGTTPFVGEGFDAPALDTLFLTAP
ncbi:MAG TPA: DEAD/DEAH box helicase family protein, partial [Microlunatus sp.]